SQTHCHDAHRSERLWQVWKKPTELFHCQRARFAQPFGAIFHSHEAHGVVVYFEQLPSHRTVKKISHQTANVCSALWREVESLQPLLNRHRFYFCDQIFAPFRLNVIPKPRQIPAPGRAPFGKLIQDVAVYQATESDKVPTWALCVNREQPSLSSSLRLGSCRVLRDSSDEEASVAYTAVRLCFSKTEHENIRAFPAFLPLNTTVLILMPPEHSRNPPSVLSHK